MEGRGSQKPNFPRERMDSDFWFKRKQLKEMVMKILVGELRCVQGCCWFMRAKWGQRGGLCCTESHCCTRGVCCL